MLRTDFVAWLRSKPKNSLVQPFGKRCDSGPCPIKSYLIDTNPEKVGYFSVSLSGYALPGEDVERLEQWAQDFIIQVDELANSEERHWWELTIEDCLNILGEEYNPIPKNPLNIFRFYNWLKGKKPETLVVDLKAEGYDRFSCGSGDCCPLDAYLSHWFPDVTVGMGLWRTGDQYKVMPLWAERFTLLADQKTWKEITVKDCIYLLEKITEETA